MTARHLPNLISLARLLLALPIVLLILGQHYELALGLFVCAGLSDGLDGLLAKRYGWTSTLGGILDPLADKVLLTAVLLACVSQQLLPLWLAGLAIGRDLAIGLGALGYRLWVGPYRPAPSLLSKLNTACLLLLLAAVLAQPTPLPVPPALVVALIPLTAVTLTASGLGYLRRGLRAYRRVTS